jgi:hypothetical protein
MTYYFRAQLGWAWPIMDSVLYECVPRTSTRTVVIGGTGQSSEVFHHVGTGSWLLPFSHAHVASGGGDSRVFRD